MLAHYSLPIIVIVTIADPPPPTTDSTGLSTDAYTIDLIKYPGVLSALEDLENDYSSLMTKTRKELDNCDTGEVKFYLDNLFGVEEFQKYNTIDEMLRKLSRDHISTFSISYLKRLISLFDTNHAIINSANEYEDKIKEFLQTEAVEKFRQDVAKLGAKVEGKPTVSIKLPTHCLNERTKKDVEELAGSHDQHKYHVNVIVTPGSIVWYVPEALCDDMEKLVKENIFVFKDDGVQKVNIVGEKSVTISIPEQVS